MEMVRHRAATGSGAHARLLLSVKTRAGIIYRDELEAAGIALPPTPTRGRPPGWTGDTRRIDLAMLRELGPPPGQGAKIYVCGPPPFVEEAARRLVELGHPPAAVRT